ncbi:vacuolar cation/proton exchanger 3-like [Rutidosis leptorrhynchoides]|uniref:vacuolar cation/proton exchanger 3-like n=1 Tax=Rutidosis leptorrhynchoides TaxID=125765 RepID=UPI003A999484
MASSDTTEETWLPENGVVKSPTVISNCSAHMLSSSSVRKKTDLPLLSNVPSSFIGNIVDSLHEVILGSKLSLLFLVVPVAIAGHYLRLPRPWIFSLSLLGLIPLAERVSFLTEQISFYTGATVGGLLNATCGNATELVIAIFALIQNKVDVVKYSLLGSTLSNLLLVLGTSLICGGLANVSREQMFDRNQSDVNISLLLLSLLCNVIPILYKYAAASNQHLAGDGLNTAKATLNLSRASCVIMLISYFAYLAFQLWTHHHIFESQQAEEVEDNDLNNRKDESAVIGLGSAVLCLVGMTGVIALLSEYLVDTIEAASSSWGMPLSFISLFLLPVVGNAAEHAGAIIFAFKNKLDITLGVALGSASQIAVFVVPLSVIVAWIIGVDMDLDFGLLETGSFAIAILVTAFTLQDGTSHYLKGVILLLCYVVIGTSVFLSDLQSDYMDDNTGVGIQSSKHQISKI